jgi:hypothetical protein
MTQLTTIPVITVEIAFSPTNILDLSQTWTDVTAYVREARTAGGRQHYLDRIEASRLTLSVDNRTGFFTTSNAIRARLPIRVTAVWSSTSYTIFRGIIDNVDTKMSDALNTDLTIQASDFLKMLSLKYLNNLTLWPSTMLYATSLYRCDNASTMVDTIGSNSVGILGVASLADGITAYDTNASLDLTNGTGTNTATAYAYGADGDDLSIDFWVRNPQPNTTLMGARLGNGTLFNDASVVVDPSGRIAVSTYLVTQPGLSVTDGEWHHIGIVAIAGSALTIIVDGTVTTGTTLATGYGLWVPALTVGFPFAFDGLLDEVVVSDFGSSPSGRTLASATTAIQARYTVGSYLRKSKNSADQVDQVLKVAGWAGLDKYNGHTFTSNTYGTQQVTGETTTVTGSTALNLILNICETEVGIFFQADDGTLNMQGRDYVYQPVASGGTLDSTFILTNYDTSASNQTFYTAPDLQYVRDDADIWTTVKVTPATGDVKQWTASSTNRQLYGESTLTKSTLNDSADATQQTANYLGLIYQSPLPRVSQAILEGETQNGAQFPFMLGANIQDRVTFVLREPCALSSSYSTMIIESLNHEFSADPGLWHTSFTLDPYAVQPKNPASSSAVTFLVFDNTNLGIFNTDATL